MLIFLPILDAFNHSLELAACLKTVRFHFLHRVLGESSQAGLRRPLGPPWQVWASG